MRIITLFSNDSSDESVGEKRLKTSGSVDKHKRSKKHKKHKKSGKGEKSHKKHKKSKRRHKSNVSESEDDDHRKSSASRRSGAGGINEKFTEIMQKASRDRSSLLKVEHSNGNKFSIRKPNIQTDASSLVEEITKTIQNKVIPAMEIVSSGTESEV